MSSVVVIGAVSIDQLAKSSEKIVMGDRNPGFIKKVYGGVGKNVAENLAYLSVDVTLITVLAIEDLDFISYAKKSGLKIIYKEVEKTPTFCGVFDYQGEFSVGISDFRSMKAIDIDYIKKVDHVIEKADIIVLDANISTGIIEHIMDTYKKPIYLNAISGAKAKRIKDFVGRVYSLKLKVHELKALDDSVSINDRIINLLKKGTKNVYLTLGEKGLILGTSGVITNYNKPFTGEIRNTSGAGDALFSGIIFSDLMKYDLQKKLEFSTALTHLTLLTDNNVSRASVIDVEKYINTNFYNK